MPQTTGIRFPRPRATIPLEFPRIPSRTRALALLTALLPVSIAPAQTGEPSTQSLEQGREAYERRAEGHLGARASSEQIDQAITRFRHALERDPQNHTARWMLLRALYFKAEYALDDDDAKLTVFEEAIDIADEGRERLLAGVGLAEDSESLEPDLVADSLRGEPGSAEIYFWSAAHWGLWGRYRGKLAAARQGVATRVRDYAEITSILDERLEEAGGHRILGRLHSEAPRLPFVTGWVDRGEAIRHLERAAELAPEALLTKLFLAEALLEFRPERRQEALQLLESVARSTPDPAMVVEETKTIEDARTLLEAIR